MSAENKDNAASEFAIVADLVQPDISSLSAPQGSLQMSADGGATWIDVDESWDGKGLLDEHRQQAFAKIKQPGFGNAGKVKTDGE